MLAFSWGVFSVLAVTRKESSEGLFTKIKTHSSIFPLLRKLQVDAAVVTFHINESAEKDSVLS